MPNRITGVLKKSFKLLSSSNPLLLSSATAFFSTFALAPILIILSHLLNLFFNPAEILPKLFNKLSSVFGPKATKDIQRIVDSFMSLETSAWITIALTVFFYFVATTLLSAIRQSIHQLWNIRKKSSRKVDYHLKERGIEIGLILFIGILFLITVPIDSGLAYFKDLIEFSGHTFSSIIYFVVNSFFAILIVSTWFTFLFRFMPEAKVSWNVALAGGIVTGTLFLIGRLTFTKLLVSDTIVNLFGPSSSIALVLLLIFYCSFILYFGAAFTHEYAKAVHREIEPGRLGNHYIEIIN